MKLLTILGIMLVPLVFLLGSFSMLVYNAEFHAKLLDQYSLQPELGKKIDVQLIEYFKSDSMLPAPIQEFTAEENQHMLDVKIRINQTVNLFLIALTALLLVVYVSDEKRMLFLLGGPLTLVPFALYGLFSFDYLFDKMHWLLFERGTWLFPPDLLIIQVYTVDFFYYFTLTFAIIAVVMGLGSALLAWKAGKPQVCRAWR